MNYILFDIGGTNSRVAKSVDLTSFSEIKKYNTPTDNFNLGIGSLKAAISELCPGDVTAIAGGIRGLSLIHISEPTRPY